MAKVTRTLAAVDLGAQSGRVMLARYDGRRLSLEEVHRFPNRPLVLRGHRLWNLPGLWEEVLAGLRRARQAAGTLDSIGVDTWGVDYGLVNAQGLLLGLPFHYRDQRTSGVMEEIFQRVPRQTIYGRTGIQFLPINTLVQLYAHLRQQPGELRIAHRLLLIPDLLHSWLDGEMVSERTNATTTQCWDPVAGRWARELLEALELPTALLPPVVEPGSVLGRVLPEWRGELGAAQVIAPATHDTGSAVAAAPVLHQEKGWAYISSGTWSLVGAELRQPLLGAAALAGNWTNEGGVFGTTRFLKNVTGLWLLQECQRAWAREQRTWDYDALLAEGDGVAPLAALIDPDDPRFLAPEDMPAAINSYLEEHGQRPLSAPGAFARCIMESLVLRYCQVLHQLEHLTGERVRSVHVLGGGSRNGRLNQWLADAAGMPVLAGPAEATALGNACMQLVGLGELHSLAEIRAVVGHLPRATFEPHGGQRAVWDEAAARFAALTAPEAHDAQRTGGSAPCA
jgi:rhamnulokinase